MHLGETVLLVLFLLGGTASLVLIVQDLMHPLRPWNEALSEWKALLH